MSLLSNADLEVNGSRHVFTTPVLPNQSHLIYGDSHLKKYSLLGKLNQNESHADLSDSPVILASSSSLTSFGRERREYSDSDLFSESLPDEFLRETLYTLCDSSKSGDQDKLKAMIELLSQHYDGDLDLNTLPFPMGNTPVHIAASEGQYEIVDYLLSENLFKVDCQDSTLEVQVAQMLLKKGADVNKVDFQGWTALHNASANGNLKLVSLLVEEGKASVNSQSSRGFTPLMDATARMFPDVVKYLLSQCYLPCDPTLKNSLGETAYAIAVSCENVYLCDLLEAAEKLFISKNGSSLDELTQVARLISVYENERCVSPGKIKGLWTYAKNFSPSNASDGHPHFSLRGTHEEVQLSSIPLPTEDASTWSWQTDWKLCTDLPRADLAAGWQYAKSFDAHDHNWAAEAPANPTNWVRRRRWFRVARKSIQLA